MSGYMDEEGVQDWGVTCGLRYHREWLLQRTYIGQQRNVISAQCKVLTPICVSGFNIVIRNLGAFLKAACETGRESTSQGDGTAK